MRRRRSREEQAERVTGGVEHDPEVLPPLVAREPRSAGKRVRHGCIEVIDPDVQVDHLLLGARLLRHTAAVVSGW